MPSVPHSTWREVSPKEFVSLIPHSEEEKKDIERAIEKLDFWSTYL
jgi:hypothetical protein